MIEPSCPTVASISGQVKRACLMTKLRVKVSAIADEEGVPDMKVTGLILCILITLTTGASKTTAQESMTV